MKTKIMPCMCKHEFQDAAYGPGMRVHNVSQHSAKHPIREVCTVCARGARAVPPVKKDFKFPINGRNP